MGCGKDAPNESENPPPAASPGQVTTRTSAPAPTAPPTNALPPSPFPPNAVAASTNDIIAEPPPVEVETNAPAPPVEEIDESSLPRWHVSATWLNVREGPAQNYEAITQLKQGTTVVQLGEATEPKHGTWYRIKTLNHTPTITGWLVASFLAKTPGLTEGQFASLNYGPIPKRNYPNNPRRQARGIYVPLNVFSSTRFSDLRQLVASSSLNAMVIDFKDDVGELLMPSAAATRYNSLANDKSRDRSAPEQLQSLRNDGVYLIARIVTFKDPIYAEAHPGQVILDRRTGRPYQSRDGLTWVSPFDRRFQQYNLALAEEAAKAGFHEVQFDYVRFPDVPRDLPLNYRSTSTQSKAAVIQDFLLATRDRLEPLQVYVAADVFGLVCTTRDDMRIGQYWEAVSNAVDYICPMMYPSHYANNSYGLFVPDQFPYELIDRGIRDARRRSGSLSYPADLRPWLQGFTATWVKGYRDYGPREVKAQIRALNDHGIQSYLMWNPAARYDATAYR